MCKHLMFQVRGMDPMGVAYCPTCGNLIPISHAFNELAKEMRSQLLDANTAVQEILDTFDANGKTDD